MGNIPIANYLYTAVISGYYTVDDWREWADRIILNNTVDDIDIWIFDVAFSTNEEQFYDAILEKKAELEKPDKDIDSIEDNISLEPIEENREDVKDAEVLEIPKEVECDFDIELFLDNLYCEYRKAIEDENYYRARDILLEYNYYCREYDVADDCFHELFTLTNKISSLELDIEEKDAISFFIREIRSNFINGRLKSDGETVKKMLNEFKKLPSSNNIYYYHRYKADYLMNISSYSGSIKEYEKAIEINPYNKHDYYKLALLHYICMKSKNEFKKKEGGNLDHKL